MRLINKYKRNIVIMLILILILFLGFKWLTRPESEPFTLELETIHDDIYLTYYRVHSDVPAHNYNVVQYCVNGKLYTIKGNVNIAFTNEQPYVIYQNSRYSYEDTANFYIPKDSIEYLPSTVSK